MDIGLPPELANIVKKAEIEAKRQASIGPKRTPSPVDTGGPEIVQIKVYWKPHPLNPNAEPQTLGFKMRRVRAVICSMISPNLDDLSVSTIRSESCSTK